MLREDISKDLVHWVRGNTEEAFEVLKKITWDQKLLGSNGHIRGSYNCICFTEAPEAVFHNILGRYQPFGVKIPKKFLYEKGGRPVIYQSDDEYDDLPEELKWRHVRYDPTSNPPIDFTWEREWRIHTNELKLFPKEVSIIVPNNFWKEKLENEYNDEIQMFYGQMPYGQMPYGQMPYGQMPYGQMPYGNEPAAQLLSFPYKISSQSP